MNKEELKQLVEKLDKEQGNFPYTLSNDGKERRKIHFDRKIAEVIPVVELLQELGVKFHLFEYIKTKKQKPLCTDIYLPDYNIVMRAYDDNNETENNIAKIYFHYYRAFYAPIFIRRSETIEFVKEKILNTIENAKQNPKKGFYGLEVIKPAKKKRERIRYVKIESYARKGMK